MKQIRFYCGQSAPDGSFIECWKYQTVIQKYYTGATIYRTLGLWEDTLENSLVFEVLTDQDDDVRAIAQELKAIGRQTSILVTIAPLLSVDFVS